MIKITFTITFTSKILYLIRIMKTKQQPQLVYYELAQVQQYENAAAITYLYVYVTGINGYLYGNLPGLNMCLGDRVVWHVFSIGSEADVHTVYFHGQSLTVLDTHRSSTAILPGYFKTLFMKADNPGTYI